MRLVLLATFVLWFIAPPVAQAEDARCPEVREQVARYGKIEAVRWARASGYSWAQIAAARRCLNQRQR
jgi:hypothetical protein